MGTTVTKSGVSVQFCDRDGNIDGPPVFSRFVRILGQPHDEVIKRTGRDASTEEKNFPGSGDWLTLVAVADSEERLGALVKNSGLPITESQTSGSSRRVQVQLHIGAVQQTFDDRVTIASGPVIQKTPPIMNVVHIKVLGEGTAMNPQHPLWKEFEAQSPLPR
jgi:hypothetical protein